MIIVKKATYHYETLKPLLWEIMDELGAGEEMARCRRVLIKPNFLSASSPDEAIVTHFMFIRATAEYVLSRGATPRISDSPAIGSFEKVLKKSGVEKALLGIDADCRPFGDSLAVDVGEPFGMIDLAKDALEADMIINLPKLKTHEQMLLTLGVKNMFGCVVGLRKPQWHMRIGDNRDVFARLLVRIYEALKPSLTILDGILAMEGEGPGRRGVPRRLETVIAARNAHAVDATVCRMLGLKEDALPTLKAARELGVAGADLPLMGELPKVEGFKLPPEGSLRFGPLWFHNSLRKHFLQRPVCDASLCRFCGECWEFCPAGAIGHGGGTLSFDYERCIRCYCCIEVCPHGALHALEPPAGRLLRKMIR